MIYANRANSETNKIIQIIIIIRNIYIQQIPGNIKIHDLRKITLPSNLSVRTPLNYGQFPMSRQNSHIFSFKKPSIIRTLSNTDNGH